MWTFTINTLGAQEANMQYSLEICCPAQLQSQSGRGDERAGCSHYTSQSERDLFWPIRKNETGLCDLTYNKLQKKKVKSRMANEFGRVPDKPNTRYWSSASCSHNAK